MAEVNIDIDLLDLEGELEIAAFDGVNMQQAAPVVCAAGGGHDCKPVEDPPDELMCPICLLPSKNPHLVSCCGRKMCNYCISQLKDTNRPCPVCRAVEYDTMIDRQIERRVLALKVYCEYQDDGCMWVGELRGLEEHTHACIYRIVPCSYDCGLHCSQLDMFLHERDTCDLRPQVALQKEIQSLKKRISSLEAKSRPLESENERQRQTISKQRATIRQSEIKIKDSEIHMQTILKANDEVNEELIMCKERKEELESQVTFLKEKLSSYKNKLKTVQKELLTVLKDNEVTSSSSDEEEKEENNEEVAMGVDWKQPLELKEQYDCWGPQVGTIEKDNEEVAMCANVAANWSPLKIKEQDHWGSQVATIKYIPDSSCARNSSSVNTSNEDISSLLPNSPFTEMMINDTPFQQEFDIKKSNWSSFENVSNESIRDEMATNEQCYFPEAITPKHEKFI